MKPSFTGILIALAILCGAPLRADVVTYQQGFNGYASGADSWVSAHHASRNVLGQNSASGNLQVRGTNSSWTASQSLIRFDDIFSTSNQTDAPFVFDPATFLQTQINSATLTLTTNTDVTSGTISFFRMTENWNPATVTYNSFNSDGVFGLQPGNETALPVVATLEPNNLLPDEMRSDVAGVKELDVTAALQAWVAGDPNFGFLISNSNTDNLTFSSFENANLNLRPLLTIDFSIVPEPASVALWSGMAALGGLVLWRRSRKRRAA